MPDYLIFLGVFGVVLGVVWELTKMKKERGEQEQEQERDLDVTETSPFSDTGTIEERLRKLKEIYDSGLINDEDYKKKKDALLKQL